MNDRGHAHFASLHITLLRVHRAKRETGLSASQPAIIVPCTDERFALLISPLKIRRAKAKTQHNSVCILLLYVHKIGRSPCTNKECCGGASKLPLRLFCACFSIQTTCHFQFQHHSASVNCHEENSYRHSMPRFLSQNEQSAAPPAMVPSK